MICQLTGFYMRATLALNGLMVLSNISSFSALMIHQKLVPIYFCLLFLKLIRNFSTYFTAIAMESICLLSNLINKASGIVSNWSICIRYPQGRSLKFELQKERSVACLIQRGFFPLAHNDISEKGL